VLAFSLPAASKAPSVGSYTASTAAFAPPASPTTTLLAASPFSTTGVSTSPPVKPVSLTPPSIGAAAATAATNQDPQRTEDGTSSCEGSEIEYSEDSGSEANSLELEAEEVFDEWKRRVLAPPSPRLRKAITAKRLVKYLKEKVRVISHVCVACVCRATIEPSVMRPWAVR